MSQQRPSPPPRLRDDLLLAVRLAWNFGYIIAIPAVLFGFGGASLDREFGTSPLLILTGFALALIISGLGIWRIVKQMMSAQRGGS